MEAILGISQDIFLDSWQNMTTKPELKTAYYEAGHAVMSYVLRRRFTSVSIVPGDDYFGKMDTPDSNLFDIPYEIPARIRKRIEADIMIQFAGAAAEEIYSGRHSGKGASGDNFGAVHYAEFLVSSDDELEPYIGWLWIRARNILQLPVNWAVVEALANELIRDKTIGYRRARRIIADAMIGS